ncbi:ABC transporter ATP-binding protein [Carnobacterium sp. 1290_CSPC]|uniref:ABC transporter ATP-binding protein n=1 Tax=Carnobacterium sp. 1290_CSPC TaxID=1579347 RepID=UPI000660BC12|nr:ABC transporter ATP-binding protein [Carnobacterium sp. 1290_CSPC]
MLKILAKANKKEKFFALLSVLLIMLQVYLELEIPDYMSEITELLQMPDTVTADILEPGLIMVGLSLASFASAILVGFFAARIAASLTARIRGEVFDKVMSYSANEINQFSVPSLVTRSTNDLTQIQMLIALGLQVVLRGPIMSIWAIAKISGQNWQWSLTTAVAVGVLLVMIGFIMYFAVPRFSKIQTLTDNLNAVTRENLTGLRVIRAYNAENYQNKKFAKANDDLTNTQLFVNRVMGIMQPGMTLVSSGLTLVVYWSGAYLIADAAQGTEQISLFSDMVVFSSYAMQVIIGFLLMVMIFMILPRAIVSAKRINEVLDLAPSIEFKEDAIQTSEQGSVEFKNVTFKYGDDAKPALKDINFKINKGETLAIIGSTGSGKSTLIQMIPRLYDVSEGQVLVDGQNVKDFDHAGLNNIVGYMPQKPVLFSGTIRSNMNLGESKEHLENQSLSDEEIWAALDTAQARDFVEAEPDQLDTHVAQGGNNFSGGQKQRLGIARVLARKPEILIFDDSFSALDYQTDKTLRGVLAERMADTTKIIVAQRISTIMDADEILVLDRGEIVGRGKHQELLADNKVYQEIAYSQLSEEELAND